MAIANEIADATWTTSNESDYLQSDDTKRQELIRKSEVQKELGLVSWGGYVFHVYNEIAETHSVELSEYPVPGNSSLGYRVQNKINMPSEVILDVAMVMNGLASAKEAASAKWQKWSLGALNSAILDVSPWVAFPNQLSGIMDSLKTAMYNGWALPYNGKYGRIMNMALVEIQTLDNEKTVYSCPMKIRLRQVLGINHRALKKSKVSQVSTPICVMPK